MVLCIESEENASDGSGFVHDVIECSAYINVCKDF